MEKLQLVFHSDTHVQMPLIGRRREILHEVAQVLNKVLHYSGTSNAPYKEMRLYNAVELGPVI